MVQKGLYSQCHNKEAWEMQSKCSQHMKQNTSLLVLVPKFPYQFWPVVIMKDAI